MRAPATLLAIPLTIGCACGLIISASTGMAADTAAAAHVGAQSAEVFAACAAAAALLALIACVGALAAESDGAQNATVCLVTGAFLVGVSSGVDASLRAYRSPLHVWFAASDPAGRPVVLRGRLREDATLSQNGVSLLVDVREVEPCATAGPASSRAIHDSRPDPIVRDPRRRQAVGCRYAGLQRHGGVAEGARRARGRVAACAHDVSESRRPGRAAGTGAPWHRACRFGQERRDGGTRRAGVAPGRMGVGVQGVGPFGPFSHRRAVERTIGWRRRRDCDRRSHGAGARRRGTAAGGRDLSRHRDLGREHRDSDAAARRRRALAGCVATSRIGGHDRRAAGVRPGHRASAVGRPCHLGRGPLSRRPAHRTAWALDQHPRRRRDPRLVDVADGSVRSRLSPVVWRDIGDPDWRAEAGVSLRPGRRRRRVRVGPRESSGAISAGSGSSSSSARGGAGRDSPARGPSGGGRGGDCRRRDRAGANWRRPVRPGHMRWPAFEPRRDSADDRRASGFSRGARDVAV